MKEKIIVILDKRYIPETFTITYKNNRLFCSKEELPNKIIEVINKIEENEGKK